jgi:hypothetical protein
LKWALTICCKRLRPGRYVRHLLQRLGCPPVQKCMPQWAIKAATALGVADVLIAPNAKYEVYYTKKMKRELALRMGLKWKKNAARMGMTRDHLIPALRAARGPDGLRPLGLSPDRQKQRVPQHVPSVSPQQLARHALFKTIAVAGDAKEEKRRPELHKAIAAANAPQIRLQAWAYYRGFRGVAEDYKAHTDRCVCALAARWTPATPAAVCCDVPYGVLYCNAMACACARVCLRCTTASPQRKECGLRSSPELLRNRRGRRL